MATTLILLAMIGRQKEYRRVWPHGLAVGLPVGDNNWHGNIE